MSRSLRPSDLLPFSIMTPSRSIIVGTLIGGAVGDAIGAAFEGLWSDDIPPAESLLSLFHEYHGYPSGQYTDDTQLTIATNQSIVQRGTFPAGHPGLNWSH